MSSAKKNARIEVRLSSELKEEIESAAAFLGQSLSDFVVSVARDRATEVREQEERTVLSNRDRDLFLAALDRTEPSEALLRSARKYKEQLSEEIPDVEGRAAPEAS